MWVVTKGASVAVAVLTASSCCCRAFVAMPKIRQQPCSFDSTLFATGQQAAPESEAERLLRKARELRAQAEAEEHAIHSDLLSKKAKRDADTDKLIDQLFFAPSQSLLNQLRCKRCSSDMLVRVVDRLHEREVQAKGLEHVEPSLHHDHTQFKRVSQVNEAELKRVEGLIDALIEACAVLDEEMLAERKKQGLKYIPSAEALHWNLGECAKVLDDRVREMRREHEEQFQKRLESFYEAQRKKDLPPPKKNLNP